jgi:hypothetical protein
MVLSAGNDSTQPSPIAAAERRIVLLLPEVGAEEIDLKKLTMCHVGMLYSFWI